MNTIFNYIFKVSENYERNEDKRLKNYKDRKTIRNISIFPPLEQK